jgi:hypothetical protein
MTDQKQSGGVNISTKGGQVSIGGDVVGRDKITTTTTTTTGIDAAALVELLKAFKDINRQIDVRKEDPTVDKEELKETVKKVEAEVKKGEEANPTKVERWLKFLGDMAPDILQVTAATLANPAMGLSLAIKMIAEKAQGQAAA